MWDVGAVPDSSWQPTGEPSAQHLTLPDGQMRTVTVTKPLVAQLAEAGYAPADITYLALSHYHYDHTANANEFAAATWLARRIERDAMFATPPPPTTAPATYSALRDAKTRLLGREDYDVFGDGTVILKLAAGHTPGHQVLYVKLPKTGGVVLSGDLYHYPAERALARIPTFDFDEAQTASSRALVDAFLIRAGAQLWIQHDFAGNATRRHAPAYYE
jgi:glyoxylase-like metal-dependent hydrolase (beta-lactamase superfamily II)